MKFVLDFDRVIFNWDTYMQALSDNDLKHLFVDPQVWDTLQVSDYLHSDALDFLYNVSKHDVAIVTAMSPHMGVHAREYQKRKLADSGIEKFVSQIVIMEGDKAPHVSKLAKEDSVFVDDRRENVESVHAARPTVACFQMVRPGHEPKSGLTKNPDIKVVADFVELSAII